MNKASRILAATAFAFLPLATAFGQATKPVSAAKVDSETISGLGARNIGSAAMSGRISALAGVHELA